MSGAMRKVAVYLGLVEDQDRYDRYDRYDDEVDGGYDDEHPAEESDGRVTTAAKPERGEVAVERNEDRPAPVAALHERRQMRVAPEPKEAGRITTLHPRSYNDARLVGEHFRDGTPVIMNLTEMDDSEAKRLVDFAAGLIFGLRGSLDRVTSKVFLLSPANVEVRAEEKARLAEGGFFNQS
jgi:cell division inhibitor SepF